METSGRASAQSGLKENSPLRASFELASGTMGVKSMKRKRSDCKPRSYVHFGDRERKEGVPNSGCLQCSFPALEPQVVSFWVEEAAFCVQYTLVGGEKTLPRGDEGQKSNRRRKRRVRGRWGLLCVLSPIQHSKLDSFRRLTLSGCWRGVEQ